MGDSIIWTINVCKHCWKPLASERFYVKTPYLLNRCGGHTSFMNGKDSYTPKPKQRFTNRPIPCSNLLSILYHASCVWQLLLKNFMTLTMMMRRNKKLISRWDSERELSLRRHCTRTKNTIDACINCATDRFLQRKFTKFSEITQCNRHYAVQGHLRSPILVPIES